MTALSRNLGSGDLSPKKRRNKAPAKKTHKVLPTSSSLSPIRSVLKQPINNSHLCLYLVIQSQKKAKGGMGKGKNNQQPGHRWVQHKRATCSSARLRKQPFSISDQACHPVGFRFRPAYKLKGFLS